ncbi:MAG: Hsp20/alpha crystallin family protein [Candidatus Saccharimonadales bacterium]
MANSLINWDPFRELDDIQDQMSRLFNRSLSGTGLIGLPATDIYEEDGKLSFETALPQFKEDEVDVQIDGDRLEIKAEHKADNEIKERNYLRRESQSASYYRQFVLPKDVDADTANAKFDKGVLSITFDCKELPQPKKLSLGTGDSVKKVDK